MKIKYTATKYVPHPYWNPFGLANGTIMDAELFVDNKWSLSFRDFVKYGKPINSEYRSWFREVAKEGFKRELKQLTL